MKKTDYAKVAPSYDDNQSRHLIEADPSLRWLVQRSTRRPLDALDLACGTGNYLQVQAEAFGGDVSWRGLDASEAMLSRAKEKVPAIELVLGRAEALPYEAGSFDYVSNNFAFHHFEDKGRALDEIRRVSRPGARLRIANIDPARMPRWWGYQFFPESRLEDEKRFWSTELLGYELEQRGFRVHVRVDFTCGAMALTDVLTESERRDASQISILTEEQYGRGLARLREAVAREPAGSISSELALLTLTAELPSGASD